MPFVPSFDAIFAAIVAKLVTPEAVQLWEEDDARRIAGLAYKAAVMVDALVAQEAVRWGVPGGWVAEKLRESAEKLGLDLVPIEVARAYWAEVAARGSVAPAPAPEPAAVPAGTEGASAPAGE